MILRIMDETNLLTDYLFQDVLENDEIKLDWIFKVSLITDLSNVSNIRLVFLCFVVVILSFVGG